MTDAADQAALAGEPEQPLGELLGEVLTLADELVALRCTDEYLAARLASAKERAERSPEWLELLNAGMPRAVLAWAFVLPDVGEVDPHWWPTGRPGPRAAAELRANPDRWGLVYVGTDPAQVVASIGRGNRGFRYAGHYTASTRSRWGALSEVWARYVGHDAFDVYAPVDEPAQDAE